MKHTIDETPPPRTYKRQTHLTCDICAAKSSAPEHWGREGSSYTDKDDVTIARTKGTSYSDGGDMEVTSVDLCPACFAGKLLPWLAAQGAKPSVSSTDW